MKYQTSSKFYRLLIFGVGVVATIAYRVIVILNHYSSLWVEIAWYIGTIGFIWYFAHRYRVQSRHSRIIEERRLNEKICRNELSGDDCEALSYILSSLNSSKAKWNSVMIFALSVAALAYATIINIVKIYR